MFTGKVDNRARPNVVGRAVLSSQGSIQHLLILSCMETTSNYRPSILGYRDGEVNSPTEQIHKLKSINIIELYVTHHKIFSSWCFDDHMIAIATFLIASE